MIFLKVIIFLGLLASGYMILVTSFIEYVCYYPNNKFDKVKWQIDKKKRYTLTQNIIESKMLIGKTKQQVSELLGSKDCLKYNNKWEYDVGFVPGLFNIDSDVLTVHFKNDIVISVSQHET